MPSVFCRWEFVQRFLRCSKQFPWERFYRAVLRTSAAKRRRSLRRAMEAASSRTAALLGAEPVGEVPTGLCWRSSTAVACLIARASACIKSRLRARVRGRGASVAARALRQDQLPQVDVLFELEASSLAGVKPLRWGALKPFCRTLHLLALPPAFCWQGAATAALWWRSTCGIVPDERGEGLTETTDLQGLHVRRQLLDSLPPGGERGVRDWSSGTNRRCSGWRDRGEILRCVCQRRSLGVCGVLP